MKEKLLIHTVNEAYSFQPDQVICIEADGNYCNLHLSNGNEYLLSFQLGQNTATSMNSSEVSRALNMALRK